MSTLMLLLTALFLLPGAASPDEDTPLDDDGIVATWQMAGGTQALTLGELDAWRRAAPKQRKGGRSEVEQIALTRVLAVEAETRGLTSTPKAREDLRRLESELAAGAMRRLLAQESRPSEEELRAVYKARAAEWRKPARWRLRNILLPLGDDAAAKMNALLAELAAGADFAALAREHSISATRLRGGDIGWVEAERLAPAVRVAVSELAPGEHTVITGAEGSSLLVCTAHEAARVLSFEEARKKLVRELGGQRRKRLLAEIEERGGLAAEAVRRGLTASVEHRGKLAWARLGVFAELALEARIGASAAPVSEKDVASFYGENPSSFARPERFLMSAIDISLGKNVPRSVIDRARRMVADLRAGELAWSAAPAVLDPSGEHVRERELGWQGRDDFFHLGVNGEAEAGALADAVGALGFEEELFSELLQEGKQLVILRLKGHRAAHTAPLEEVREAVRERLEAQRRAAIGREIEAEILAGLEVVRVGS